VFGSTNYGFLTSNTNQALYVSILGGHRLGITSGNSIRWQSTAHLNWVSGSDLGAATDLGLNRFAASVLRVTNGSTGAGQLLLGSSSDTIGAQLDVRSQSTTRIAGLFAAAAGTGATQEILGVYSSTSSTANPVLSVVNGTSAVTGISVTGAAAGSGVTIAAISSGASERITLIPKTSSNLGTVRFQTYNATDYWEFNGGSLTYTKNAVGQSIRIMGDDGGGTGPAYIWLGANGYLAFNSLNRTDSSVPDVALARSAAGVLRVAGSYSLGTHPSAGQLLLGTSSDTIGAQLDVRSQSTTRAALRLDALSGTAVTQKQLIINDGSATEVFSVRTDGGVAISKTITAESTTGNQTINKASFTVNFATATSSLTVTNSLVTINSNIICTVQTDDTTLKSVVAVPGSGSIVLTGNAAATAETRVGCFVLN
jgi:hypothetical protein